METNYDYANDVGKQIARMMEESHKSRKHNTLTKEKIKQIVKQIVEDFLSDHDEKELNVKIYLDSSRKKPICSFQINTPELETIEGSTKAQLAISDFTIPKSLLPDDVTIHYEEVTRCEPTFRMGETKDDILVDVLDITFKNGTVLELGFLKI